MVKHTNLGQQDRQIIGMAISYRHDTASQTQGECWACPSPPPAPWCGWNPQGEVGSGCLQALSCQPMRGVQGHSTDGHSWFSKSSTWLPCCAPFSRVLWEGQRPHRRYDNGSVVTRAALQLESKPSQPTELPPALVVGRLKQAPPSTAIHRQPRKPQSHPLTILVITPRQ